MRCARGRGGRPHFAVLAVTSPAAQALVAGSTSTTIEMPAPTGGSGTYTASSSTSAGSLSGTAPGTLTLSGLSDGAVAQVVTTYTDTATGQTTRASTVITVSTPPAYTDLTVSSPAGQQKASGSTSTTITFGSPSGGSGSSTGDLSLSHVVGSGASVSGSAPGTATVSGLQDGDVVAVTATYTDSTAGQVVRAVCAVSVDTAATPVWTAAADYDFTALDGGQSWTAAQTVSLTFSDAQADLDGVVLSYSTGTEDLRVASEAGSGLRVESTSGAGVSRNCYVAVPIPAGIPASAWTRGAVEVQAVVDGYTTTGANSGTLAVYAVPGAHSPNTNGRAGWVVRDAATDAVWASRYSGASADSTSGHTVTIGGTHRMALRILPGGGMQMGHDQTAAGVLSVSDNPANQGWAAGHTTSATISPPNPFGSGGYIVIVVSDSGSPGAGTTSARLKRLRFVYSTSAAEVP